MKKIFALFIGLVLAGFIFSASFARAEGGLQISPVSFNLETTPGATNTGKITIKNLNSETINYSIEVELFSKVSDEGAPSFEKADVKEGVTSLVDWITFSPKEGKLEPKKDAVIDFSVDIPEGAEPGGHYAAIFARQLEKTADGKTQLGVTTRVGSLILVSVPGDVKKTVNLKEFSAPKFIWKGPVTLGAKAENTGTVHYDSEVKVNVKPLLGSASEVNLGKHTIIPKNERSYTGLWSKKYPIGYYKFTASASDGDGKFTSTKEASAFALPLIFVIPLIAVILIVILIVRYVKKNYKVVKAGSHKD